MPIKKTNKGYVITSGTGKPVSFQSRDKELDKLIRLAKRKGLTREAQRAQESSKLSLFQRLGRGLTSFETGEALYGSLYEDKPFLKTYATGMMKGLGSMITGKDYRKEEPKKTFKDIMMMEGMRDRPGKLDPVDIAGLAGDIFTDPTTFMGSFIGKGIAGATKKGVSISKKVPLLGKRVKGGEEAINTLFKPFHKIEQLGETGKVYRASYDKFVKGTRTQVDDFMEVVAGRAKKVKPIKRAGTRIGVAVETRGTTGIKLLDDIKDELVGMQNAFTKAEKKRGILQTELPDYMHHMITPQAADFMRKGGNLTQFIKPIRVKLGAAKGRKLTGVVGEINKEYAEKLGFNLFEENAFKAFAKRGVGSIQAVKTYDFLQNTAIQFGKKTGKDFIDEKGIRWVGSAAPELKGVRFPEPIVKHIDEFKSILSNDEATNALIRTYDKVLNLWKGTVTGYFPAFHTRNALGGIFNNYVAGLKNPATYLRAENILKGKSGHIVTKTGKKITYEQIRRLLKEYGVTGQTGYLDVMQYLKKEVSPSVFRKMETAPAKVMGAVENRLRTPLFIDGLKKGLTAEQAAKRVIKYHFDYMPEGFTAFERTFMKRVIPFYTWTRHNIPLQIEQMIMQPGKYAGVFKTQRALGLRPGTEEEAILPRWLREKFVIKGEGGYWTGLGLPLEEATEKVSAPLRGFGISLSPLIKTPIEQLTGYNIFKEKRIEEDTYGKQYKNMPDFLKKWLELKEQKSKKGKSYYTVNPHKKYWLELIGARGLSTALRLSNTKEDRNNVWSLITTIKKYEYDPDELKRWVTNEKKKELEKALYNSGLIRKFERYYQPK